MSGDHATRVVSLNLCVDQWLLQFAPERIAALSWLADDPSISRLHEQASDYPTVRLTLESILSHQPDMVLAMNYTPSWLVTRLERLGVPVMVLEEPTSIGELPLFARALSEAIGMDDHGEGLQQQVDEVIAPYQMIGPSQPPLSLVLWTETGFTNGHRGMIKEVIGMTGWRLASDHAYMHVEELVASPPDMLVVPQVPDTYASLGAERLRHPALVSALPSRRSLHPNRLICAEPGILEMIPLFAQWRMER